jgi:hypothetical protein
MKSLFGEWLGADLNSGHPGIKKNRDHKWAGKSFVSVDDVKPMMVYDDNGNRVWDGAVSGACVSLDDCPNGTWHLLNLSLDPRDQIS